MWPLTNLAHLVSLPSLANLVNRANFASLAILAKGSSRKFLKTLWGFKKLKDSLSNASGFTLLI